MLTKQSFYCAQEATWKERLFFGKQSCHCLNLRRTTQETFLTWRLDRKVYFSSRVRKQFKRLSIRFFTITLLFTRALKCEFCWDHLALETFTCTSKTAKHYSSFGARLESCHPIWNLISFPLKNQVQTITTSHFWLTLRAWLIGLWL